MKNNKGFSLVELIVVIAIMAILAAVAIPTFAGFITKANKASDAQFYADLEYAIQMANAGTGKEVSGLTVTTDGKGVITKVEYKLDTTTVTIAVSNDAATVTAPADNAANKETVNAAKDVIAAMDWSYDFKSAAWADGNGND